MKILNQELNTLESAVPDSMNNVIFGCAPIVGIDVQSIVPHHAGNSLVDFCAVFIVDDAAEYVLKPTIVAKLFYDLVLSWLFYSFQ